MKKEFIKGIAAGVAFSVAVGAGGYLGYKTRDNSVLSDTEHVQKLKYLEHLSIWFWRRIPGGLWAKCPTSPMKILYGIIS